MKWSTDGGKALISDKNEVVYAEMIPEALDKPSFYWYLILVHLFTFEHSISHLTLQDSWN